MAQKTDIERATEILLGEVPKIGERLADSLFAAPGPDSKKLTREAFLEHVRTHWPEPDWRMDFLNRYAPPGKDGSRPENGLKNFVAVAQAAFPQGRPADAPPPAPPQPPMDPSKPPVPAPPQPPPHPSVPDGAAPVPPPPQPPPPEGIPAMAGAPPPDHLLPPVPPPPAPPVGAPNA